MTGKPKITSRRAQFYLAVSKKHEKAGNLAKAIENLEFAKEEDPFNSSYYDEEIRRLNKVRGNANPEFLKQVVKLYQDFAVSTELPDWYENAESSAAELVTRLDHNEYDAIEELVQLILEVNEFDYKEILKTDWAQRAESSDRDKFKEDRHHVWAQWAVEKWSYDIEKRQLDHQEKETHAQGSLLKEAAFEEAPEIKGPNSFSAASVFEKRLAILQTYIPLLSRHAGFEVPVGQKNKVLTLTPVPNSDRYSFYPNIDQKQVKSILADYNSFIMGGRNQAEQVLDHEEILATFISAGEGLRLPKKMIFTENYFFDTNIVYQNKGELSLMQKMTTGGNKPYVKLSDVSDLELKPGNKMGVILMRFHPEADANGAMFTFFEKNLDAELVYRFLKEYILLQ